MLELTAAQVDVLRELLGVPGDAPDPTADDLITVLDAEQICQREYARWHNMEAGE